ncbi:MAG TPA: hypothetical protein VHW91_06345 [Candidatus Dormibacteraeota bacterium]|jgi:hypothetical protein|nr:hypothetical protein [Candidatus Dormibacteraeota bacterium]
MQIYSWLVLIHVAAVLGFVFAHGGAAFISFRVRHERNIETIAEMIQLAELTNSFMYPFFWVLVIFGLLAGANGGWFGHGWIWAAIVILIVVTGAMYGVAAPYYRKLREALGLRGRGRGRSGPRERAPDAEILSMLDSRRPEIIAAIGSVALLLLLWLMLMKPF